MKNVSKKNYSEIKEGEGIVILNCGEDMDIAEWMNNVTSELVNDGIIGESDVDKILDEAFTVKKIYWRTDLVMMFSDKVDYNLVYLGIWCLKHDNCELLSDYAPDYSDDDEDEDNSTDRHCPICGEFISDGEADVHDGKCRHCLNKEMAMMDEKECQ